MTTPAGWYPNPEDSTERRYWDGTAWTDHVAPAEGHEPTVVLPVSPPPPPPPPPPPGASAVPQQVVAPGGIEPWYRKKWVWVTAGVIVVAGIVGSLSGNDDPAPAGDKAPSAVTTVTATPQPTATVTVESTPTEAAEEPADSEVGNNPTADGGHFVMPNEVGKNLQAAQDDLQAITGDPFFYTGSEDATGAGRFQAWDSNWKVCSQKPKAGTRLSTDYEDIVFFVVKNAESCP